MSEEQNKIVLSIEDAKNIRDYFKHFGIDMSNGLIDTLTTFESKDGLTFENQQRLKMELCKAMLESEHESFKDQMFDVVKETAGKAVYDLQFEFDIQETLTKDDKEEEKE